MLYALLTFLADMSLATAMVLGFWVLVIRFGETDDLDKDSLLVRWFAKKGNHNG